MDRANPPASNFSNRVAESLTRHTNFFATHQNAQIFINNIKFLASGLGSWSDFLGSRTPIGSCLQSISLSISYKAIEFEVVLYGMTFSHRAVQANMHRLASFAAGGSQLNLAPSVHSYRAMFYLDEFNRALARLEGLWKELEECMKELGPVLGLDEISV